MKKPTLFLTFTFTALITLSAYAQVETITGYYYDPESGTLIPRYGNSGPNTQNEPAYDPTVITQPATPPATPPTVVNLDKAKEKVKNTQAQINLAKAKVDLSAEAVKTAQKNADAASNVLNRAQADLDKTIKSLLNPKNLGEWIQDLFSLPGKWQAIDIAKTDLKQANQVLAINQSTLDENKKSLAALEAELVKNQADLDSLSQP